MASIRRCRILGNVTSRKEECALEVSHQRIERHLERVAGITAQEIAHREKSARIDTVIGADLSDRAVAEAERDVEAAYGGQKKCVVANKLPHGVGGKITLPFVNHNIEVFFPCKITNRKRADQYHKRMIIFADN